MGEISKALGLPESFEFRGKKYQLAPITFEVMAQWEQYLEDRAFAALDRQKRRCIAAEFARKEQALIGAIAAGDYSFFSPISAEALSGSLMGPGLRKMMLLRLQAVGGQEASEELVNDIVEEQAETIMRLLQRMDAPDPNSQGPVTPGAASEPKLSSPNSSESPTA